MRTIALAPLTLTLPMVLVLGCGDSSSEKQADPSAVNHADTPQRPTELAPNAQAPVAKLIIDYSNVPTLVVNANGASKDEILSTLADKYQFTYSRSPAITEPRTIHSRVEGELAELIGWVLLGDSFVIEYESAEDNASISGLHWLAQAAARSDDSRVANVQELQAADIEQFLASGDGVNKDFSDWLKSRDGSSARIRLYDAPQSVSDLLQRLLPGTEGTSPNGVDPRHLRGANDAAQNTVSEALARTTAMARRNVEVLVEALDSTCVDSSCAQPAPDNSAVEVPVPEKNLKSR